MEYGSVTAIILWRPKHCGELTRPTPTVSCHPMNIRKDVMKGRINFWESSAYSRIRSHMKQQSYYFCLIVCFLWLLVLTIIDSFKQTDSLPLFTDGPTNLQNCQDYRLMNRLIVGFLTLLIDMIEWWVIFRNEEVICKWETKRFTFCWLNKWKG